ncbi:MAG TPA: PEGA domain-containing protein [Polyangiaceae bacterium]|jgi:hypothetical protein|nr:PEGA domain-containing protein [Polyangiaceae bacterium]
MDRPRGLEVGVLFAVAVALLLGGPDAAAQAAPPKHPRSLAQSLPPDARRDYDAGKLLFEDGDYATALLKYQAALDETHDPRLLWNVAVCQKDLRHYAKAAATLARYLAEGGDLLSASDRHDAQELARAIAPFTVPTTLRVSEPDAQIWIDDVPVGRSPLAGPVALDMGTRRVRVKKDGFRLFEREFPVGGSAATTIDVTLERQGGHLQLNVPADATVWLDEHEMGHGPRLELDLPVGAHAMRLVAPRMRPLQTDVVVEDGKSRVVDLALEAEPAPLSEVHVAVRCVGPDPLSPDALAVFFDDATESALPLGARIRREPGHEVLAYVAYRVAPGRHLVHVAAPHCEAQDATVDAPEGGITDVKGELAPSNHWLEGSPAGSPDGWRLSAGLVESSTTFADYQNFFSTSLSPLGNIGTSLVGPSFTAGLQGRWLTALLDARFQLTRVTGNPSATTAQTSGQSASYDSTLSVWSIGARPGVRVPLVVAALSTGVGLHFGQYFFAPDTAGSSRSGGYVSLSYWGALDAQPFCEWGMQVGASTSYDSYGVTSGVGNGGVTSLWLQATYTPNSMCTKRRAGLFKIEGTVR